jgi:hypothetical protein
LPDGQVAQVDVVIHVNVKELPRGPLRIGVRAEQIVHKHCEVRPVPAAIGFSNQRLMARLWFPPAAMAMKSVLGDGTSVCPLSLNPHVTMEPSALRPRLWLQPAAMAMKPVLGKGTFV